MLYVLFNLTRTTVSSGGLQLRIFSRYKSSVVQRKRKEDVQIPYTLPFLDGGVFTILSVFYVLSINLFGTFHACTIAHVINSQSYLIQFAAKTIIITRGSNSSISTIDYYY